MRDWSASPRNSKTTAPKAARFLEKGRDLEATLDLEGRGVKISARMRFSAVEDAELAARAMDLFARLALGPATVGQLELSVEHVEQDVSIEVSLPPEILARLFRRSARELIASLPRMRYAADVERQSYSHRVVFIALAVSLLVAMGTALFIYEEYIKTTPVAAGHLPADVTYAVRLDVEQVVSYEPFRVHLLQVFETNRDEKEPRVKHLERKTTLELGIDSRELVFAQLPDSQWLILLGGVFRRDGVLDGVMAMLKDEGIEVERQDDLLVHPSGQSFGVAEDGTLVLGSSPTRARAALQNQLLSTEDFRRAISRDGTIAGVFGRHEGGQFRAWLQPGQEFPGSSRLIQGGKDTVVERDFDSMPTFFLPRDFAANPAKISKSPANWQLTRQQYAADVAELAKLLKLTVFGSQK